MFEAYKNRVAYRGKNMSERKFKKKLEKMKKKGERYKQIAELKDMYAEYLPDKKKKKTVYQPIVEDVYIM